MRNPQNISSLRRAVLLLLAALAGCGVSAPAKVTSTGTGTGIPDGGGVGAFAITLSSGTPTPEATATFTVQNCGTVEAVLANSGSIPLSTDPGWQQCMTGGAISAALLGGMNVLQVWARGSDGTVYDIGGTYTVVRNSMFGLGDTHSCALIAGGVQCWGNNSYGQLGNGTTIALSALPVPVLGLTSGVLEIGSGPGGEFTCALRDDGTVWCWGRNELDELGNNTVTENCNGTADGGPPCSNVPVQVMVPEGDAGTAEPLSGVSLIAVGATSACAGLQSGPVECWGNNVLGQDMNGESTIQATTGAATGIPPTAAIDQPSGDVQISAGVYDACMWSTSSVVCSGADYSDDPPTSNGPLSGILGAGNADQTSNIYGFFDPTPVTPAALQGLPAPTMLSLGYFHGCALVGSTVLCWGANYLGQYGDGSSNPGTGGGTTALSGPADLVVSGAHHACARGTDGTVSCWGMNDFGQLGSTSASQCPSEPPDDGLVACSLVPLAVPSLTNVAAMAASRRQTCAASGTTIWCWGGDDFGELGASASENCAAENGPGNGPPVVCSHTPVAVLDVSAGPQ